MQDIYFKSDLQSISNDLRQKKISCQDLTRYYLNRIAKYNALNCMANINVRAMTDAEELDKSGKTDLPLFGLPFLVKDNIDVENMITSCGSVALKDNLATNDADVVRILKQKGAIVLGKTNMTEFANIVSSKMPNGFSSLGGQVINAYNRDATCGGSSSGSAVAVSCGLCAFSIGTDTSFSVVGCATENGVVGFRPSHNRLSTNGVVTISKTLDDVGFFTKRITDLIYLYEAVFSSKVPDSTDSIRFAVNKFNSEIVSNAQIQRYKTVLAKLKKSGVIIEDISQESTSLLKELMLRDFAGNYNGYAHKTNRAVKDYDTLVGFYNQHEDCRKYGADGLIKAHEYSKEPDNEIRIKEINEQRETEKQKMLNGLQGYQACLMTGPLNTFNFTGLPSLSLPIAVNETGLPRSMIMYGTNEIDLLRTAKLIEKTQGVADYPQICNA